MKRILFIVISLFFAINDVKNETYKVNAENIFDRLPSHIVTATFYNPVKKQCQGNSLITANGSRIDMNKLRKGKIRWVAISRDLKKYYKFNDKIYVQSNNPKINGIWEIKDVMNRKHKDRIDFLSHDIAFLSKPEKVKIYKVK